MKIIKTTEKSVIYGDISVSKATIKKWVLSRIKYLVEDEVDRSTSRLLSEANLSEVATDEFRKKFRELFRTDEDVKKLVNEAARAVINHKAIMISRTNPEVINTCSQS